MPLVSLSDKFSKMKLYKNYQKLVNLNNTMQTIQHAVKQYTYIQVEQYSLGTMIVIRITVSLCKIFKIYSSRSYKFSLLSCFQYNLLLCAVDI